MLFQYIIPSRSIGGSRAGMSNSPLVLFQVYFADGGVFEPIRASCDNIEHTVRSRFMGRVSSSGYAPLTAIMLTLPFTLIRNVTCWSCAMDSNISGTTRLASNLRTASVASPNS